MSGDFLRSLLHLLSQFGRARLRRRIEIERPHDHDEFSLRFPKAFDWSECGWCRTGRLMLAPLPGLRIPNPFVRRRDATALGIVERRILGPGAGEPLLE